MTTTMTTQHALLSEYAQALEEGDNQAITELLNQVEPGSVLDSHIYTFHRTYRPAISFEGHLRWLRMSGQIGE